VGIFSERDETDGGEDNEYFIEVVGSTYEVAPVLSFLYTTALLADA
jgi:hypothetical protein